MRLLTAFVVLGISSSIAAAQTTALDVCSKLVGSGLVDTSNRVKVESSYSEQLAEACRFESSYKERLSRLSASVRVKARLWNANGILDTTSELSEGEAKQICSKDYKSFGKYVYEEDNKSTGSTLVAGINDCLRIAVTSQAEYVGGYVTVDAGSDDTFMIHLLYNRPPTFAPYYFRRLGGNSGVTCYSDSGRTAVAGLELIPPQTTITCKRKAAMPVTGVVILETDNRPLGRRELTFEVGSRTADERLASSIRSQMQQEYMGAIGALSAKLASLQAELTGLQSNQSVTLLEKVETHNGSSLHVVVMCPPGMRAIGGGVMFTNYNAGLTGISMSRSSPYLDATGKIAKGWEVMGIVHGSVGIAFTSKTYAVCTRLPHTPG